MQSTHNCNCKDARKARFSSNVRLVHVTHSVLCTGRACHCYAVYPGCSTAFLPSLRQLLSECCHPLHRASLPDEETHFFQWSSVRAFDFRFLLFCSKRRGAEQEEEPRHSWCRHVAQGRLWERFYGRHILHLTQLISTHPNKTAFQIEGKAISF